MRWPAEWRDPGALELLKDTPVDALFFTGGGDFGRVIESARRRDIAICNFNDGPSGVEIAKGEWPGVRMAQGNGDASAGPTGAPWIDSNGWLARLARVRKPQAMVWVWADAPKSNEVMPLARHLVALADAAAHGARWVTTLDKGWADDLAARKPQAIDGWKKLTGAMAFFQAHSEWSGWPVDAVLSVVSSFSGPNEFFSHELLNLMARTNVSYGIVPTDFFRPDRLVGLRAALYPDAQPPAATVRDALLDFAEHGGLLITGPKWGPLPGKALAGETHPRYELRGFGKGRIALAFKQPEDPYEMAQDAQILLSHRYDVLRFFNGFLLGGYATVSPEGKRRMAHVINYGGDADEENPATARIAGRFRSAKLWALGSAEPRRLEMVPQKDAIEVPLPGLAVYGGVELEGS